MTACRVFVFLLIGVQTAFAQLRFQSLRYQENYRNVTFDSSHRAYARFKYLPSATNPDVYLSQGGEVRYLVQYLKHEDWGESPVSDYTSFYTRFLYHVDLHVTQHARLFAQLNSTFAANRVTPNRAIDENQLDVQQVFVDLQPVSGITLRVGRQELLYGSQRIIAVREGPNNRQSYDAVKLIWKRKNLQTDWYVSRPVRVQQGIFNDAFNRSEKLWSVYAMLQEVPHVRHADLYYIGYQNDLKAYASGLQAELRHSLGTRIWNKSNSWSYDFEALYQFGSFGEQQIRAYTASLDLTYTFSDAPLQPAVGIKTEVISGDKNPGDRQLNTFNPLFPRGAYFGLAALIGPANLIDFHPAVGITPVTNLEVTFDYDVFLRHRTADGIYGPNVAVLFDGNSSRRFIGQQAGLSFEYKPSAFVKLNLEFMYFLAGPYLDAVSAGDDVTFAAFVAQVKF